MSDDEYIQWVIDQSPGDIGAGYLGLETAPADFRARRPAKPRQDPSGEQFGFVNVKPRYSEQHAGGPLSWSPEERARWQVRMVKAGILEAGASLMGDWDATSDEAFRALLSFANRNGYKAEDALDAISRAREETKRQLRSGTLPSGTPVMNRADLEDQLDQFSITLTGSRLDPERKAQMADAYQGLQSSAALDAMGATGAIEEPPTLEGFAGREIRRQFPQQIAESDFLARADEFYELLGGVG